MRRFIIPLFVMSIILITSIGCDRIPDILGSYPGLTVAFERATNNDPFPNVHVNVVDFASSGVSGADGKVTLTVPQQAERAQIHVVFETLSPFETRTKDYWVTLGKGENFYKITLQDDPRKPY